MTCPFLDRLEAGDRPGAARVALAGDNPVEAAVLPTLLAWADELIATGELAMAAGVLSRANLAGHGFPP